MFSDRRSTESGLNIPTWTTSILWMQTTAVQCWWRATTSASSNSSDSLVLKKVSSVIHISVWAVLNKPVCTNKCHSFSCQIQEIHRPLCPCDQCALVTWPAVGSEHRRSRSLRLPVEVSAGGSHEWSSGAAAARWVEFTLVYYETVGIYALFEILGFRNHEAYGKVREF